MRSRRDPTLLLLAFAAGGIDAVVLFRFGALVAAQTGNTVLLGLGLGRGRVLEALPSAVSVIGYVAGTILGDRAASRRDSVASVRKPLALELVFVAMLLVAAHIAGDGVGPGGKLLLIGLAAIAMGAQSATVMNLHRGVTTTYVTGTLTTFSIGVARWRRNARTHPADPRNAEPPWLYGVTWIVYLAGALASASLIGWLPSVALLLPLAMIALVMLQPTARAG